MADEPPSDPADHAAEFARRWADRLDRYAAERMEQLGIPPDKIGASSHEHGITWCAFNSHDRDGGNITTGVTVNSGVLNPDLLKGKRRGAVVSGRKSAYAIVSTPSSPTNGRRTDSTLTRRH